MSMQKVVERILSDAESEACAIVAEAETKAAKLLADASARAETERKTAETEAKARRNSILEKRAADARLDGAKLLLGEKRKVVATVYDEAHSRLLELSKENTLRLFARLLETYAETGDEIYFSTGFAYENEVKLLPVVKARGLTVSETRLPLEGGMRLKGVKADKDLSYVALLAADREEYQAQLAKELFK